MTHVTDVQGCARCHGNHERVEFKQLTNPIELDAGRGDDWPPPLTHWAACPTNGEPILLCIFEENA